MEAVVVQYGVFGIAREDGRYASNIGEFGQIQK